MTAQLSWAEVLRPPVVPAAVVEVDADAVTLREVRGELRAQVSKRRWLEMTSEQRAALRGLCRLLDVLRRPAGGGA